MNNWEIAEGKLYRKFIFEDFVTAFDFMSKVALKAEELKHHPEWTNVYNTLEIKLSTHDAAGVVTEKDHELAAAIDTIYAGFYR